MAEEQSLTVYTPLSLERQALEASLPGGVTMQRYSLNIAPGLCRPARLEITLQADGGTEHRAYQALVAFQGAHGPVGLGPWELLSLEAYETPHEPPYGLRQVLLTGTYRQRAKQEIEG